MFQKASFEGVSKLITSTTSKYQNQYDITFLNHIDVQSVRFHTEPKENPAQIYNI